MNTKKTTAVAKTQKVPKNLSEFLEQNIDEVMKVAPKHMTPERIIRIAITATSRTPALKECTPISILGCVITSAQLGLELDDVRGYAYMIPFNNKKTGKKEAQFMPGYKGLRKLALNHPDVLTVRSYTVYEGDAFDYGYGLSPYLDHHPCDEVDRGGVTHFYAVVHLKEGIPLFKVVTVQEALDHKKRYSKATTGPWVDNFNEMAEKTAIIKVLKEAPETPELTRAIALDDAINTDRYSNIGGLTGFAEKTSDATKSRTEMLRDKLTSAKGTVIDVEIEDAPEEKMPNEESVKESSDESTKPTNAEKAEPKEPEVGEQTISDAKNALISYVRDAKEADMITEAEYAEECKDADKPENRNLVYMQEHLAGWKQLVQEKQAQDNKQAEIDL